MMQEHDKVYICDAYICALEYGDYTGLSDEDTQAVETWLKTLPPNPTFIYGDSDTTAFTTDVISGLKANCVEVGIYYWKPKSES